LDPAGVTARTAALHAHLQADARWRDAKRVAAFVGAPGEPGTLALLTAALNEGKQLWLPRVLDAKAGRTELLQVTDLDALVAGGFGLQEPAAGSGPAVTAVDAAMELDVVLVPGLGFDRWGGRLGHGPGHYDRLLAPIREHTRPWRVGVCFSEFFDPLGDEALPVEPHDVPMHAVVTDAALTECSPEPSVPHVIEAASSARAKCRSCGLKIDKGALRFGERVDNPFGDGLATFWFHLSCGAVRRPEPFDAVLQSQAEPIAGVPPSLVTRTRQGVAHPRLPRLTKAMRDPSGRARCRHCTHRIGKALWRVSLSIWQDGRFEGMGFIHSTCAKAYFECDDAAELIARAEHGTPDLDPADLAELAAAFEPVTAAETDS